MWPHRRQPTRLPRPWDSPGKNTEVGCHFLPSARKWKVKVKVKSCPTPSDPMDCSLPGSSIHGIFQARVPEWGAIAFGGMYITDNVPFLSHDIKDTCYQHDLVLSCPDHLTEVVLVRFLHCKFSLLHFAYCPLWKKVAMSSPYLGMKNYAPTPWRWGIYICRFEFFCMGYLSPLPYLFIQLWVIDAF